MAVSSTATEHARWEGVPVEGAISAGEIKRSTNSYASEKCWPGNRQKYQLNNIIILHLEARPWEYAVSVSESVRDADAVM